MVAITDAVGMDIEHGIALLTVNNPPVNALSISVREGIFNGLKKAFDDDSVSGIVVICEGRTFIAGADISEFGKPPQDPNSVSYTHLRAHET